MRESLQQSAKLKIAEVKKLANEKNREKGQQVITSIRGQLLPYVMREANLSYQSYDTVRSGQNALFQKYFGGNLPKTPGEVSPGRFQSRFSFKAGTQPSESITCRLYDQQKLHTFAELLEQGDYNALANLADVGVEEEYARGWGGEAKAEGRAAAETITPGILCALRQLAHEYNVLDQQEQDCQDQKSSLAIQIQSLIAKHNLTVPAEMKNILDEKNNSHRRRQRTSSSRSRSKSRSRSRSESPLPPPTISRPTTEVRTVRFGRSRSPPTTAQEEEEEEEETSVKKKSPPKVPRPAVPRPAVPQAAFSRVAIPRPTIPRHPALRTYYKNHSMEPS